MGKSVLQLASKFGEMSERFKEPVLKTGDTAMCRGFESHSLRHFFKQPFGVYILYINLPLWRSTQVVKGLPTMATTGT